MVITCGLFMVITCEKAIIESSVLSVLSVCEISHETKKFILYIKNCENLFAFQRIYIPLPRVMCTLGS